MNTTVERPTLAVACATWLYGATTANPAGCPSMSAIATSKSATAMFADVRHHRPRRLRKPST